MHTIHTSARTDADGNLTLRVPVDATDADYEVTVTVRPTVAPEPPEARGRPPGYFETTFGSIDDV